MSALDKHSLAEDWQKAFDYLDKEVTGAESRLQASVRQYVEIFSLAAINPRNVNREHLNDAAQQVLWFTSDDMLPAMQHHYADAWEGLKSLRNFANNYAHFGLN